MTSAPVKGTNSSVNDSSLLNYVSSTGRVARNSTAGAADSFDGVFGQAAGRAGGTDAPAGGKDNRLAGSVKDASRKDAPTYSAEKPSTQQPVAQKPEESHGPEEAEPDAEAMQALDNAGNQLVQEVADKLGVSVEDVEKAMEALGFTLMDLFKGDNMAQLVVALTPGADMISLVTDAGLYNTVMDLQRSAAGLLDQLAGELELTPDQMNKLLAEAVRNAGEKQMEPQPDSNIQPAGDQAETEGELPTGSKDYTVTVEKNGQIVEVSVKANEKTGAAEAATEEVTGYSSEIRDAAARTGAGREAGDREGQSEQRGDSGYQSLAAQWTQNTASEIKAERTPQVPFEQSAAAAAQTRAIMDQIMDQMRIQIRPENMKLEMQLHPASLGTVGVEIASKAGVITAQFIAQNESVKTALESQIVQLKTNFEQQGIKVEAVEVTLASHSFERNLNQNGDERGTDDRTGGSRQRRLNLSGLDGEELPGDMNEEEKLSAQMMAENGNTVDYTA